MYQLAYEVLSTSLYEAHIHIQHPPVWNEHARCRRAVHLSVRGGYRTPANTAETLEERNWPQEDELGFLTHRSTWKEICTPQKFIRIGIVQNDHRRIYLYRYLNIIFLEKFKSNIPLFLLFRFFVFCRRNGVDSSDCSGAGRGSGSGSGSSPKIKQRNIKNKRIDTIQNEIPTLWTAG